jgi:undecaprenyl-diphosphatase
MTAVRRSGWRARLAGLKARDRGELALLAGAFVFVLLLLIVIKLAGEVLEGETLKFDKRILLALRSPQDPSVPIGPRWLVSAALDITALGSPTVIGLTVIAVSGFLVLHGMWRNGLFVAFAAGSAFVIDEALKQFFQRARPDVVPHLRDVVTMSFPSGHALMSAVVYLTLGALSMRIAGRQLTRFYCMAIAMLITALVGASRVYLGVHYPTDVIAGWLIGLSWALLCWMFERTLERRAGWKRERAQAEAQAD